MHDERLAALKRLNLLPKGHMPKFVDPADRCAPDSVSQEGQVGSAGDNVVVGESRLDKDGGIVVSPLGKNSTFAAKTSFASFRKNPKINPKINQNPEP